MLTPADFQVDDDSCGVTTLIDSFAATADQERLREKAQRNLAAIQDTGIDAPNVRGVISSIWMRSLSSFTTRIGGGTRVELQLDITRTAPVDDNAFTAELAGIIENSINIHPVRVWGGAVLLQARRESCLETEGMGSKRPEFRAADGDPANLLPVCPDQEFIRKTLEHLLRSPDGVQQPPSRVIVLDPNWERTRGPINPSRTARRSGTGLCSSWCPRRSKMLPR